MNLIDAVPLCVTESNLAPDNLALFSLDGDEPKHRVWDENECNILIEEPI